MRWSIAALPLLLAGCVSAWPTGSYVQTISPADATILAPVIADYLAGSMPAGQDVALAPAGPGDAIASALGPDLDRDGFLQSPTGMPVSYIAAPLDQGVLLRISIGNRQGASRYFARADNGVLVAAGPLTVAGP